MQTVSAADIVAAAIRTPLSCFFLFSFFIWSAPAERSGDGALFGVPRLRGQPPEAGTPNDPKAPSPLRSAGALHMVGLRVFTEGYINNLPLCDKITTR